MLAGTEYANDTRPSPSSTTVAALVRAVASKGLDTNNLVVQVTGPSFTCVSGTSLVAPSSGTTCADGSSQTWYLQISATYTVAGLMSGFMSQATWTVSDSAIVCLQ